MNKGRLVCDCMNVFEKEFLDACEFFKKDINNEELFLEQVKDKTQAGLACRQCLREHCDKVDVVIPNLINEFKNRLNK